MVLTVIIVSLSHHGSILLSMSTYCNSNAQSCAQACCNIYGNCNITSSNPCYFYYNGTIGTRSTTSSASTASLSVGAIAGIAVGTVILVVGIALLVWWKRRRQQQLAMTRVNSLTTDYSSFQTQADLSIAQYASTNLSKPSYPYQPSPIQLYPQYPSYINQQYGTPQQFNPPVLQPAYAQPPTIVFAG